MEVSWWCFEGVAESSKLSCWHKLFFLPKPQNSLKPAVLQEKNRPKNIVGPFSKFVLSKCPRRDRSKLGPTFVAKERRKTNNKTNNKDDTLGHSPPFSMAPQPWLSLLVVVFFAFDVLIAQGFGERDGFFCFVFLQCFALHVTGLHLVCQECDFEIASSLLRNFFIHFFFLRENNNLDGTLPPEFFPNLTNMTHL